jgi:anaerobic selenocysteine-containing dehydrogenase/Fe-S-cluster-containing dehydrogenase component
MSEGMKRRDFLKVLGASGAGAATVGCTTGEVERLIPYVVPAEEIVPGVPTWYTTTCRECPAGCGLHVETHSGRATKVEGNPDHPISHGNTCARGQASVQGLYHPDRYQGPAVREPGIEAPRNLTWTAAEQLLAERIRALQAAGRADRIVFLTYGYTGTMERLVTDFVGGIGARRVVYETLDRGPRGLNFAGADLLVSFGADFLETWGSPVDYAWQFSQMRSYRNGQRGRFIWIGAHRPLTGLNADLWIAPRPGTEALIARALAGELGAEEAARQADVKPETLAEAVRWYREARSPQVLGPGTVMAGPSADALASAISRLRGAHALPATPPGTGVAGSILQLVEQMRRGEVEMLLIDAPNPAYTLPQSLKFAEAMQRVPVRVSFSTFPDETSQYATLLLPEPHFLEKWDDYVPQPGVFELVQPTMRPVFNTKQAGDVLLSVARNLGTDVGGGAATYYDYLRAVWAARLGGAEGWRLAVKRGGIFPATGTGELVGPGLEGVPIIQEGVVAPGESGFGAPNARGTAGAPSVGGFEAGAAPSAAPVPDPPQRPGAAPVTPTTPALPGEGDEAAAFEGPTGAGTFNLVVYPSYRFYDGRTANRPWLLELPDPVTKVSWRSWVEIHPRTAQELGIEQGDVVELTSPFGSVEAPAYVYPGVRPDTVAMQMGLGHTTFGRYTEGMGVNPNYLLGGRVDPVTGLLATYGVRVRVKRLGDGPGFPEGLFEHGVRVQHDRELAQAISLVELARKDQQGPGTIPGEDVVFAPLKGFGGFEPVPTETDPSAYPPPGTHYGEYVEGATRWAMAVDLSRCIGCSACVVACYAENNIPVVGPTEMAKGRMMHWLRIERYWGVTRDEEEALSDHATDDTRFLPMLCQHCGNAPCEPVCPVYAAYHTPDGLNGQVYNRCVGTRYCANNCPWKVRYFNWFTYDFAEPLNWQLNPDVAVREKGVMEKCTFCVQRIREGERNAALENRPVLDGEVVPACVQTCPTEVFVFGNIQDPNSKVAQAARSNRSYRTLEVTNAQPAIVYLKKVTLSEPAHGGHHAPAAAGADPATQETH